MAHSSPPSPPPDDLEALRRLLLQPEQEALEALQDPQRWEEQVSQVLPAALVRRLRSDKAVHYALYPVIEAALVRLAHRNPQVLVDVLFPVLLPAIRRAVANLFASLIQSLNQTLDQAFSLQGLRWRLEALTSGKSFAEVVLAHTLLYRVEQVLLIHRESGLLLTHLVAEGVNVQDGALISGMLTAIGDFVRDSFDPEAGLNTVNFGERVLVVEQNSQIVLAVVVQGTPPPQLQERLQEAILEVHTRFAGDIRNFSGDTHPFQEARPILEPLLETRYIQPERRPQYTPWLALGVLLLALGGWGWDNFQSERAWKTYLERLNQTPGLVVTEAPRRYQVRGLRDPIAPDPQSLLEGLPLQPERLQASWQPYQSLDPEIVLRRIQKHLDTPSSVELSWRNGVLVVAGQSTPAWLSRLRNLAPLLGVEKLDVSQLRLEPLRPEP